MIASDSRQTINDDEFAKLYSQIGGMKLAVRLKVTYGAVKQRRRAIEARHHIAINAPPSHAIPRIQYPHRTYVNIEDGLVLIGSDAHIWPGPKSPAMRGFIKLIKQLKPALVILNGDVMDFPQISKHDPLGWEHRYTVQEEIEAAVDAMHQIAMAAGRARKIWTLGNHDARFEKRLAVKVPEYAKLNGFHLKDYFPLWEPCWSAWINENSTHPTVVKHRFRAGEHAPWNNVIKSGTNIVTAHLHSAKIYPFTSYTGTLYGVDCGCLADVQHKAFVDYTEDSPKNWRSGFCVLNFVEGRLLQPQLALVHDEDHLDFCGELIGI
jgi:hypothetical protein